MSVSSFFSRLNPLLSLVLRTPVLHWLLSPGLMLITVTGRKSGRQYTIPVGYQRTGQTLTVLVSEARSKQWWRNYREPGRVTLRIRGRVHEGEAELVAPGSPEFVKSAERTLRRVPGMDRVFHVQGYDKRGGLSDEQAKQLAGEIAVVRITLDR